MLKRWILVLAAVVPLLFLVSCGDDDDGGGEASTSIEATADEYEFDPDEWTVPVGQEFTIDFENGGTLEHEWAVIKLDEDIDSEEDFEEDKVLFEVEAIQAGESTSEGFTVDEAGTYQVICAIAGHFDLGMEGQLTVE